MKYNTEPIGFAAPNREPSVIFRREDDEHKLALDKIMVYSFAKAHLNDAKQKRSAAVHKA